MGMGISGRRHNVYKCPVAGASMAPKGPEKRSVWLEVRE